MGSCEERYGSSGRVNLYKFKEKNVVSKISHTENLHSIKQFLRSVFLPQGFPQSVSDDYFEYQIWDTLQAFSTSITGTIATQAILKGVGVGDAEATVTAATITWILKDGTGMVGRILFAWMKGSSLDSDCKKWRMYADILNDLAILLDIISPFTPSLFTFIICTSGVLRSVVCVAGGATRAAITQHQAISNNMADVAAKDGSQETLVNLAGLLVSLLILPFFAGNPLLIWIIFTTFTLTHLYANYRAVTCIVMDTLNQTRLSLVVSHYVTKGHCPDVREVNKREPVIIGLFKTLNVNLGCSYSKLISFDNAMVAFPSDLNSDPYILNVDIKKREVNICLKRGTTAMDQLKACYQAELLQFYLHPTPLKDLYPHFKSTKNLKMIGMNSSKEDIRELICCTHQMMTDTWVSFKDSLLLAGWKVDHVMLGADEWRLHMD